MKTLRAILFAALLAAFFAGGIARAEEESPPTPSTLPAQVAQAQAPALSADSHPATLGDLRHTATQINGRMDRMEDSLRAEMIEIRETIRWLILVLVAVMGLPHMAAFLDRRRGNGQGKYSSAASLALAAAPFLLGAFAVVAAIAG